MRGMARQTGRSFWTKATPLSTTPPTPPVRRQPRLDWLPDWILRATSISLDNDNDVGIAHGGVVSFKGIPILPIPAVSFPLTDKRKSGFLPPTIGVGTDNGIEVVCPITGTLRPIGTQRFRQG
jgi:lipopolysaccharide assembly outer membrane protein LptD (OstA)